ncbi:MAG: hypothetical protein L7F77_15145, partial [Candidatus Magnetominusculus sp. LBB02]|nr:hypothetical protein [Candidatus Magnetominusculus sp. LBB02]
MSVENELARTSQQPLSSTNAINYISLAVGAALFFTGAFYQFINDSKYVFPLLQLLCLSVSIILIVSSLYCYKHNMALMDIRFSHKALIQFYIIMALQSFWFYMTSKIFFTTGNLYWDNLKTYSYFYDNLHALNHFGEPAWWFPHIQRGMPGYFYSLLGNMNCNSPVFITLGVVFWLLGKAKIVITSFQPLYVWYFCGIIPLLSTLSIWLFSRHILRSSGALCFVIIIGVFSPGNMFNITDIGYFEPSIYCLFFLSAFLFFIKRRDMLSFWLLCLTAAAACIAVNYPFMVWAILFIPSFIIVYILDKEMFASAISAFKAVKGRHWLIF